MLKHSHHHHQVDGRTEGIVEASRRPSGLSVCGYLLEIYI